MENHHTVNAISTGNSINRIFSISQKLVTMIEISLGFIYVRQTLNYEILKKT
jgi:hypothetical protein